MRQNSEQNIQNLINKILSVTSRCSTKTAELRITKNNASR